MDNKPEELSVLVISATDDVWGAQESLLTIAPLMRAHGVRLTLASPGGGMLTHRWDEIGLPRTRLTPAIPQGLHSLPQSGGLVPKLSIAVRDLAGMIRTASMISRESRSFDLVHSYTLLIHLPAALGGRWARTPTILDVHDTISSRVGRSLCALSVRIGGGACANSSLVAESLGSSIQDLITVIGRAYRAHEFYPGPPNTEVRRQLCEDPGEAVVTVLCQLIPRKELEVAVEGVRQANEIMDRPVQLAIVGEPRQVTDEWVRGLRGTAEKQLGKKVRFVGRRSDVGDVLRASDVVVSTARNEAFGRSILEAQACGIPVLAVAGSGATALILDGETGLLFPAGESSRLADLLRQLLTDESLRNQLVANALARTAKEFSAELIAGETADLYRRVKARYQR